MEGSSAPPSSWRSPPAATTETRHRRRSRRRASRPCHGRWPTEARRQSFLLPFGGSTADLSLRPRSFRFDRFRVAAGVRPREAGRGSRRHGSRRRVSPSRTPSAGRPWLPATVCWSTGAGCYAAEATRIFAIRRGSSRPAEGSTSAGLRASDPATARSCGSPCPCRPRGCSSTTTATG
jgi:hypothetical protein